MGKRPLPPGSTCYACDQAATTREHAPPRGFYPKNYQQNLIEVPSCPEHNNNKSDDDNYTIHVLGAIAFACRGEYTKAEPEPLALEFLKRLHHGSKMRKFLESPSRSPFTKRFWPELEADGVSIGAVLKMAALAIYFYERGRRWPGDVVILSIHPAFADGVLSSHPAFDAEGVAALERAILDEAPMLRGPHPEFFGYQFMENHSGAVMRFLFYRNLSFIFLLIPYFSSPRIRTAYT